MSHLRQLAPPQSTSVSLPFCTTSEQLGVWQRLPEQTELVQSVPTLHVLPGTQLPQVRPPQSTSVSSWFFTVSLHVAATHVALVHTKLAQSLAAPHFSPAEH
jgi:hypothetical protein